LDVKDGSHHLTVSYNYFHDHHKVGLLGSGDSDTGDRYITFHHNRYENVGSRTPLQRFGLTHIFNNYYHDVSVSGINVRMGGVALIESNYFDSCANPVTSRDSKTIGYWDLRDNFVGSAITWSAPEDGVVNAKDWTTTKAFPESLGYTYSPDKAECVKAIATALAGAKL
jgi:pectate lyase